MCVLLPRAFLETYIKNLEAVLLIQWAVRGDSLSSLDKAPLSPSDIARVGGTWIFAKRAPRRSGEANLVRLAALL